MNNSKIILCILLTFFLVEFSFAQDWANLKRFEKENTELTNPKSWEDRIVFMGNSITIGWLEANPDFFAGKPYVNRGISGQTTPQMLLRFRQDVIDLKPSAVVILAGINDIAGNTGPTTIEMIVDNIVSMAELAIANNIKVVLCSVLPAYAFPWAEGLEPAGKVVRLNSLIKSYADKQNIVYVDYFSAMANDLNGLKDELGEDGVHPNVAGYKIMEPLVEDGIAKALFQE